MASTHNASSLSTPTLATATREEGGEFSHSSSPYNHSAQDEKVNTGGEGESQCYAENSSLSPDITVTFTSSSASHRDQYFDKKKGVHNHQGNGVPKVQVMGPGALHVQDQDKLRPNLASGTAPEIQLISPTNSDILKTLNAMNVSLKGELSNVTSKMGQMTSQVNKVENDLQSYEQRWEKRIDAMDERLSQLEKNDQSLDKRWELHRANQSKELSIIQTGIDSNSSAVLELKNSTKSFQELEGMEKKIERAANRKFQALKDLIKTELKTEINAHTLPLTLKRLEKV